MEGQIATTNPTDITRTGGCCIIWRGRDSGRFDAANREIASNGPSIASEAIVRFLVIWPGYGLRDIVGGLGSIEKTDSIFPTEHGVAALCRYA